MSIWVRVSKAEERANAKALIMLDVFEEEYTSQCGWSRGEREVEDVR